MNLLVDVKPLVLPSDLYEESIFKFNITSYKKFDI